MTIQGTPYILYTAETATVMAASLKAPVQSLPPDHRQTVLDALDFLLHAF